MPGYHTVLILWADGFDELAATAFTTTLRKAGMRVRVVGSARTYIVGANGLALLPDMTLDQAGTLTDDVAAVILPAGSRAVKRLGDDPRVHDLIGRACKGHALLITSAEAISEVIALAGSSDADPTVASYGERRAVVDFTYRLAKRWDRRTGILPKESETRNSNC